MPRLEIARYETDPEYRTSINGLIEKKMVVGFCIFGGTLESIPIILEELQAIAKKAGSPELLMSCDCEWGLPMRLHSGGTEFPHLMALEQMKDLNGIRRVAFAIGTEMSVLGLHWNFAPVADINSNPQNPIINIRAFSGDPETVAICAESFYKGLEDAGIISTAKHFPGHGDTHIDSHRELPSIAKSAEEFEATELAPFKRLAAVGIPSIMTGHIAAPKLSESLGASAIDKDLPATISPYLTAKLLREQIGFEGVIITDSLEMHGLQKVISDPSEIAAQAYLAGADILLMPTDPVAAYKGLEESLNEGRISLAAIEKSVERIENLRKKYIHNKPPKVSVQWIEHEKMATAAATNSLILEGAIPKPLTLSSVLLIASGAESEKRQRETLQDFFLTEFPGTLLNVITRNDPFEGIQIGDYPLIITIHRPRGALTEEKRSDSIRDKIFEIIAELKNKNTHLAGVIALGDPYIAEEFVSAQPDFILRSYSDSNPSVRAVIELLKNHIISK